MKQIQVREEFNINDLGDFSEIVEIIPKLDIESNSIVELNLRHCFIDYPATSQLIDRILDQLNVIPGKKELIIIQDYYLPESTILNLLLLGSKYFNIVADKEIELEVLQRIINEKIEKGSIVIQINVVSRTGEIEQTYKYGK